MELIRNLNDLQARKQPCVATIGNFDGFHLGHRAVLSQLRRIADLTDLPMSVLVFEPQPLEFFNPVKAPARLTRWREKYQLLREYGVDRMVCLRFDDRLASLSAEAFVRDLLLDKMAVKHLLIGDDFRFGKGRAGDYELLCELSRRYDFQVERSETFLIDGDRVSSSRIREALQADDLSRAARLLGWNYSISGRVKHGDQLGRALGFPTANIELRRMKTAIHGIFVASVTVDENGTGTAPHPSVAYIGTKPTLGGTRTLLEAHVFDYAGDLYGKYIKVEFLRKLRDDKRFDSFDLLKKQIGEDVKIAKEYFIKSSKT